MAQSESAGARNVLGPLSPPNGERSPVSGKPVLDLDGIVRDLVREEIDRAVIGGGRLREIIREEIHDAFRSAFNRLTDDNGK